MVQSDLLRNQSVRMSDASKVISITGFAAANQFIGYQPTQEILRFHQDLFVWYLSDTDSLAGLQKNIPI